MNGKEFKKALDNIVKEKNIDPEIVYEAMELALIQLYQPICNIQGIKQDYEFTYEGD